MGNNLPAGKEGGMSRKEAFVFYTGKRKERKNNNVCGVIDRSKARLQEGDNITHSSSCERGGKKKASLSPSRFPPAAERKKRKMESWEEDEIKDISLQRYIQKERERGGGKRDLISVIDKTCDGEEAIALSQEKSLSGKGEETALKKGGGQRPVHAHFGGKEGFIFSGGGKERGGEKKRGVR